MSLTINISSTHPQRNPEDSYFKPTRLVELMQYPGDMSFYGMRRYVQDLGYLLVALPFSNESQHGTLALSKARKWTSAWWDNSVAVGSSH
jgi:hypothetical protein